MENTNSSFFFHNFAFYSADFYILDGLKDTVWPILSFKREKNGVVHEFSAGYEFQHYPFFGLQYHPEKLLYETNLDAELSGSAGLLNLRFAEMLKIEASKKKNDKFAKLPISQLPDHLKCTSLLGQNVLIFRYIIAYDCNNVIPQYYKESHFQELVGKDGVLLKIDGLETDETRAKNQKLDENPKPRGDEI